MMLSLGTEKGPPPAHKPDRYKRMAKMPSAPWCDVVPSGQRPAHKTGKRRGSIKKDVPSELKVVAIGKCSSRQFCENSSYNIRKGFLLQQRYYKEIDDKVDNTSSGSRS
jgi:hypothetical protein